MRFHGVEAERIAGGDLLQSLPLCDLLSNGGFGFGQSEVSSEFVKHALGFPVNSLESEKHGFRNSAPEITASEGRYRHFVTAGARASELDDGGLPHCFR